MSHTVVSQASLSSSPRDGRLRAVVVSALAALALLIAAAAPAVADINTTCGMNASTNTTNILCAGSSVCSPAPGGTVSVRENINVTSGGCEFDLGGRTLDYRRTFQMTGQGFIKFVNVGNVTLTDTGKLKARGDFVTAGGLNIQGGLITIDSSGIITINGVIDVSGDSAGTIQLTAQNDVNLTGSGAAITGNGISAADEGERFSDGGELDIVSIAGNVLISAPVNLIGQNQAAGGIVAVTAAKNITISQPIT